MIGAMPAILGGGGPAPLADFDYRTAVVADDFSSPNSYEDQLWDFQTQTVAGKYDNGAVGGTATLDNTGGLTDQTAPEVASASGYDGAYNAWEVGGVTDKCTASDAGICQPVNVDFAFRVLVRSSANLATNHTVCGNYTTKGWLLYAGSGNLRFLVKDTTLKEVTVAAVSSVVDGGSHVITGWYNHSAKAIFAKIDNVGEVTAAAAAGEGDFTGGAVGVGKGFSNALLGQQVFFLGYVEGANAQAYYDETVKLPGRDPGVAAGKTALTTTSRNSLISHQVDGSHVGHFSGGTTLATCQLPVTFSSALDEGNGGLGLYCNSDVVNLVPDNRGIAGATGATTNTANFADASDGFRAAAKAVATASPDFVGRVCVVVAETQYTGSVFIKEAPDTVGTVGRVYAYDLTNGAEIAGSSTAYTADGTWEQRIRTPAFTTPALCVSVDIRAEITNSGEGILPDFWQLELGDGAGAIINTSGGSASLVFADYQVDFAAGLLMKSSAGEIEIVYVTAYPTGANATGYLIDVSTDSNNNDRIAMQLDSGTRRLKGIGYNSAAGIEFTLFAGGAIDQSAQENTGLLQWDETGGLEVAAGADGSLRHNGGAPVNDIGSYSTVDTTDNIQIGNTRGQNNVFAPNAWIRRIRIWKKERV